MEKKNSDGVLAPIVAYSWVGSIVLGVIAAIFNWETLGLICIIVFMIDLVVTFIPAIISFFE